MMKIVFVSGNIANGGAQRVISIVANELSKRGYSVSIVVFSRMKHEYTLNDSVKIVSLAKSEEEYRIMSKLKRAVVLRSILNMIKPDIGIGFIQGGYALFLASMGMGFKKISTFRNNPKVIFSEGGFRTLLLRLWYRRSDAIVVQNKEQKEMLSNKAMQKTFVIPNPTLANVVKGDYEYRRQPNRIIMIGRLEEQKNYDMAIYAIYKLRDAYPDIELSIYGEGGKKQDIQDLIKKLGLTKNVHLRGWTDEVKMKLKESDIFLLTSNYEGMPNVLMEAMLEGLPCISTNCETGPSELIVDGINGYLIDVGNVDLLANIVEHVIKMTKEDRCKMGTNAQNYILENYGVEKIADMWEDLFHMLNKSSDNR